MLFLRKFVAVTPGRSDMRPVMSAARVGEQKGVYVEIAEPNTLSGQPVRIRCLDHRIAVDMTYPDSLGRRS